jgi:hypothetical protein
MFHWVQKIVQETKKVVVLVFYHALLVDLHQICPLQEVAQQEQDLGNEW